MTGIQVSPARADRRRRIETSWVIGVVLFTIARFVVAYGTLRQYGMNVWWFGVIDLATAVPYGIGTARLVTNVVDHKAQAAARWGMIAAGSFLAPYLYIGWAGRDGEFPPLVSWAVVVLALCFGVNAAIGIGRRVRTARVALPVVVK